MWASLPNETSWTGYEKAIPGQVLRPGTPSRTAQSPGLGLVGPEPVRAS